MTTAARDIRPYHFQRQETLERGRLRHLAPTLDTISHRLGGSLTAALHTAVRVEIGEMRQDPWELFATELPEPTFIASAALAPGGARMVLHVPPALAMAIVEIRLGSKLKANAQAEDAFALLAEPEPDPSAPEAPGKPLTEIEQRLVGEVARRALADTVMSLDASLQLQLTATTSVTTARFLQVPNPGDIWLFMPLRVEVADDVLFEAGLWIPISLAVSLLDVVERNAPASSADGESQHRLRARVLDAPVNVAVRFPDITLSATDLLSLAPGDFIPLQREQGLPLHLTIDGAYQCDVIPTAKGRRLACTVVEAPPKEDQ